MSEFWIDRGLFPRSGIDAEIRPTLAAMFAGGVCVASGFVWLLIGAWRHS